MEFTYQAYEKLIGTIREAGYEITDYHSYKESEHPCILRHDVDMDLERAAEFAEREAMLRSEVGGAVHSTYFVLISSDFYNLYSEKSQNQLKRILKSGHEIGLHFDEKKYMTEERFDGEFLKKSVAKEAELLSQMIEQPVQVVSMHRPSKQFLASEFQFEHLINSYDSLFFKEFKYLSDSRMHWRENVEQVISERKNRAVHLLTHPFWYQDEEQSMHDLLKYFIKDATAERYASVDENFRDLKSVLKIQEIQC